MQELDVSLVSNFPWYVVKVIKGVDVKNIHQEGFAEIGVDSKYQGKYLNICVIESVPSPESCKGEKLYADRGDLICVWATAVEQFKLFEYGDVSLIRNADIFLKIPVGTPLYTLIEAEWNKKNEPVSEV